MLKQLDFVLILIPTSLISLTPNEESIETDTLPLLQRINPGVIYFDAACQSEKSYENQCKVSSCNISIYTGKPIG